MLCYPVLQTGQYETPTEDMYAECQELLQMFGLPYIIAPMEVMKLPRQSPAIQERSTMFTHVCVLWHAG